MSKTPFHRFNRQLDQEPQPTDAKSYGPKVEKPTFSADTTLEEDIAAPSVKDIKPDLDSLKFLFGELGSLLQEEPIQTNPVPMEPVVQMPPSTVMPDAEPHGPVIDDEEEEVQPSPVTPVAEAKVADFHELADTLVKPRPTPRPTAAPTPVPTPAPTPAPAPAPVERKGWVFTVHRNKQTNLIERIEADPKP